MNSYENNRKFKFACSVNDTHTVKHFLSMKNFNPTFHEHCSLQTACSKGHAEIVELLFTHDKINPSFNKCSFFIDAIVYSYTDIIDLFLDNNVDLSLNTCVKVAAQNNNSLIFQKLLNKTTMTPKLNIELIHIAHQYQNAKNVFLLMSLPTFKYNENLFKLTTLLLFNIKQNKFIDLFKQFNVDFSHNNNSLIKHAESNHLNVVVAFLWKNLNVKKLLRLENHHIYKNLISNDIKDKMKVF